MNEWKMNHLPRTECAECAWSVHGVCAVSSCAVQCPAVKTTLRDNAAQRIRKSWERAARRLRSMSAFSLVSLVRVSKQINFWRLETGDSIV